LERFLWERVGFLLGLEERIGLQETAIRKNGILGKRNLSKGSKWRKYKLCLEKGEQNSLVRM